MQFEVYPMPQGRAGLIVDIQSRLLEQLAVGNSTSCRSAATPPFSISTISGA